MKYLCPKLLCLLFLGACSNFDVRDHASNDARDESYRSLSRDELRALSDFELEELDANYSREWRSRQPIGNVLYSDESFNAIKEAEFEARQLVAERELLTEERNKAVSRDDLRCLHDFELKELGANLYREWKTRSLAKEGMVNITDEYIDAEIEAELEARMLEVERELQMEEKNKKAREHP